MFLGLMTDGPRTVHATIAANKRVASKNAEGLTSLPTLNSVPGRDRQSEDFNACKTNPRRKVPLLSIAPSRCLPDGRGEGSAVKTVCRQHLRVLAAMRKRGQSERDPFHGKIQT